ncbi:MAG: ATP-binding protein [Planctomycetota bacterium]
MLLFLAGFCIALAVLTPVCWLIRRTGRGRDNAVQKQSGPDQLEELSLVTGGLAHEIKNPLSTIKVNLKLAAEDIGGREHNSARALRKISVIQKETDRIEKILDDFLRYVGKTELNSSSVDINELMSDMIDFYSAQAAEHSITIRQGPAVQPLICKADPVMLKQVILNLFINAQQAMPNGGELIIRTSRQADDIVIEISDTGVGIDKDKLGLIFKAYYSTRLSGSGLGLSTAKKIVEAHGGAMTVNSEPGKGTSFLIKLPLQPV